MYINKQQLLTLTIVSTLLVSLAAFAGASAATETTITGPDSVDRPDTVALESTVDVGDDGNTTTESFTLTLHPADSPDESVEVTFAPDGTILGITPERGAVGQGEIRIELLRESLDVTLDERTGGYGYDSGETVTYDISFSSKALKHGEYEAFLSVNTDEERGLYPSNVASFEVNTPSGVSPPAPAGGGDGSPDDRGPDGNGPSADRGTNGNGPPADLRLHTSVHG